MVWQAPVTLQRTRRRGRIPDTERPKSPQAGRAQRDCNEVRPSRSLSARQGVHVRGCPGAAADSPVAALHLLDHAPSDASHALAFDRDHRVSQLADHLALLFLAKHVLDDADLNEGHWICPFVCSRDCFSCAAPRSDVSLVYLCLTRASQCRTLSGTVIDNFTVSRRDCTGAAHQPKVYFTQSVMHNPTGADISPHVAFKVLQAAERHNFTIVEDDIFCDLQAKTTPRLATLDQLNRVIYARSFSKTLSGSLRVGFVACAQNIANELADIKMLTSITTSQFTERIIYLMLVDGHYRKYLSRLRERLGEARLNVVRVFERMGLELFVEPTDGMFVWARFPHVEDSLTLAEASQRDGIMLAPG